MQTKCKFISVWDDGIELRSDALYDSSDGTFEVLQIFDVKVDILHEEYLELEDGTRIDICEKCHEKVTSDNEWYCEECR